MHFHLPKPLHGWREFAGEVGVIVLGVVIALGLEQAVESWHWHDRVDHAVAALGFEVAETLGQGQERLNVARCVDRRLDELASIVDDVSRTGRLVASRNMSFAREFASSFDQPRSAYSICQPISAPLLHYGASPIVDAIGNATRHKALKGHAGSPMGG